MLKILVSGVDDIPENAILDAEMAFDLAPLPGDDIDRFFISEIDRGEYASSTEFTDRFGIRRSVSQLSTGCRAALAVHHRPDLVINCTEVGDNALSVLIGKCTEGAIILPNNAYAFCTVGMDGIDVLYRGYRYTSFDRFAKYMYDEWPDAPQVYEDDSGGELCTA